MTEEEQQKILQALRDLIAATKTLMEDVNRHSPQHCICGNWLEVDIPTRKVVVVPPPEPQGPLLIRIPDGKVLDFKRVMSEGGRSFNNYCGTKKCGEFDPSYLIVKGNP